MAHSLHNLFSQAWEIVLGDLGTTTLSIILFSFGCPILAFLILFLQSMGRRRMAMTPITRAALRDAMMPTVITACVVTAALGLLFAWAIVRAVYHDHQALAARIAAFETSTGDYAKQIDALKKENAELRQELRKPPKPPALGWITDLSHREGARSTHPDSTDYELWVEIEPAVVIRPVRLQIIFDIAFEGQLGLVTSGGMLIVRPWAKGTGTRVLEIGFDVAIAPNLPLTINLDGKGKMVRILSVKRWGPL